MKRTKLLTLTGVLAFLLLCVMPNVAAQSAQLGMTWAFNSSSGQTGLFSVGGLQYFTLIWIPNGTVSGCTLTVDGNTIAGGATSTGSLVGSQSCTSAGSYTSGSAVQGVQAKVTPTITGSGTVTVFLFGYVNNPASSGGGSGNVVVTNTPNVSVTNTPTVLATQSSGANLHVDVDNNQTSATGTITTSSNSSCTGAGVGSNGVTVATGGAGVVALNVTGSGTGSIGVYYSVDGSNYQAIPANVMTPVGGGASAISFSATGQWQILSSGFSDVMVCGPSSTNSYTINLQASLAPPPPPPANRTPADAASAPANAVAAQSWPMGWNGSTYDRLRTAGAGNGISSTGLLAADIYCEYLSSLPTLTTGQYAAAQCDPSAFLITADMMSGTGAGTAPTHTSIAGMIYTPAGVAPSSGQGVPLQSNAQGSLIVTTQPAPGSSAAGSYYSNTSLTTAIAVKAGTGNVYGILVTNGSTTAACYLEIINASSSPSLGTAVQFSVPIPESTSTAPGQVFFPIGAIPYAHLTTGISVGIASAEGGSSACGTAGQLVLFYD